LSFNKKFEANGYGGGCFLWLRLAAKGHAINSVTLMPSHSQLDILKVGKEIRLKSNQN
jgi:hypothetical protein